MSRINNSFKNIIAGTGGYILDIILRFITRTIFINIFTAQYLGINGLFSNIISMLSLAELGVGSAITYNLYKPIAQHDEKHIALLMKLYKNAYRIIGLAMGILGIILIPFLPYIIKDDLSFINANLVFCIFLLQSVSSYFFFAYKRTIIVAHQKEYIVTIITSLFSIISSILKILILLIFESFILYLLSFVIVDILCSIFIAIKSDSMFPYLKEKATDLLPKQDRKEIIKNCYAIFIYKVNVVVQDATDNIVLSTFIGLNIVGIYSNYLLIISIVKKMLFKLFDSLKASIGDLHASEDIEHELFIFKAVNFFTMYIFGLASIGIFVVVNEFITVWIGDSFILGQIFVLLLAFEMYIFGLQKSLATFRVSMGLFQQAKYRPIFNAIINLIVSIILVQYIGIHGVLIGTIVSSLLTFMWFDPYIIYKYGFNKSVKEYYITNIKYILVIILSGGISFIVSKIIIKEGIFYIIISTVISIVVTTFFVTVFYRKSKEFKYIYNIIKNQLKRLKYNYRRNRDKPF